MVVAITSAVGNASVRIEISPKKSPRVSRARSCPSHALTLGKNFLGERVRERFDLRLGQVGKETQPRERLDEVVGFGLHGATSLESSRTRVTLMPRCLVTAALVVLMTGCGGSSRPHASSFLLADPHKPLRVSDRQFASDQTGVRVRDVSFAGRRGRVGGYLVLPAKPRGRLASVLLLHGSGGSRSDFLPYAERLAAHGFAALTLTAPSSFAQDPAPGLGPRAILRREQQLSADDVVAVRRAVDFLDSRASIDPHRIGLVGWSAGARTGAVLAGIERRIRAFVLMSAGAVPVTAYIRVAPVNLRPAIRSVLGTVDPLRWIARGRPGTIFLQDGRHDEVVPRRALLEVAHAAPARTRVRWYDAGHPLNGAAYRGQLAWLEQRLAAT